MNPRKVIWRADWMTWSLESGTWSLLATTRSLADPQDDVRRLTVSARYSVDTRVEEMTRC